MENAHIVKSFDQDLAQIEALILEMGGMVQPAPAPRFSRTVPEVSHMAGAPGSDTDAVLADCGFSAEEVASLKDAGAIG